MIEEFAELIRSEFMGKPGAAFHSGRLAFSRSRDLYVLGLNPGGDPESHKHLTVEANKKKALGSERSDWSAYLDESWEPGNRGKLPRGQAPFQLEMQDLMKCLDLKLREVPASDVFFLRSRQAHMINPEEKKRLREQCWPFHRKVIRRLDIRVILCLYREAAEFVREKTGAYRCVDRAFELSKSGKRKYWRECFEAPGGLKVVQITRPTGIPWVGNACELTKRALAG